MNEDDIERQAQDAVRFLEGIVPREVQGIVLIGVLMLLVIGAVWFFRMWSARNREAYAAGRKKRSGSRRKTRKAAVAAGFEVDDVQREMPEFGKGMIYAMNRKKCARYAWGLEQQVRAKWSLLCRPEEQSPGIDVRGWLLQANHGELSGRTKEVIAFIARDIGEPKEFFEIEVTEKEIVFYWLEGGGAEAVDTLLSYVGRIKEAL